MSDKAAFARVMAGLTAIYRDKAPSTKEEIEIWWRLFDGRDMAEFGRAVGTYITDPDRCQWSPKPGDIMGIMDGRRMTADEVIAEARLARTPFGVLARQHIGTHDLSTGSPQLLRQRAHEVVILQDELKQKIREGRLTDHETKLMERYAIDTNKRLTNDQGKP